MGRVIVSGLANGGIYGLIALGLVLVYRGSRVLNFGLGEIGTFTLFVAWAFNEQQSWPWWAGASMALVAAVAIGLIFEGLVVRRMAGATRLAVAVSTVGLFLLLFSIELKVWGLSPRVLRAPIQGLGPEVFGFNISYTYMLAFAAVLGLGIALTVFLTRTDFGLGVLAASQDPVAVRLVGVRVATVSAFTWGASAFVSGLGAILIEPAIGAFSPGFMSLLFVRGLAAALLGGLSSLSGAFIGGVGIGLIESIIGRVFIGNQFPGIQSIAVFFVIILVLLFRPQGILGKSPA